MKLRKSYGCLISLDFFKAYDRVFLGFLLKVMKKMNFGKTFISWIAMLHKDAQTRFILSSLSQAIAVNFSIRQGDPIAMILYIIYVEPLLVALEERLAGLPMPHAVQDQSNDKEVLEGYCDDLNILTNDLEDFEKLAAIITSFEGYSGAILSRNYKCKVIGFGKWVNKDNWPIPWLRTVRSVKIFGIFISDSYSEIINDNWNFRFEKFKNSVMSWSTRALVSVQQKVEVIKIFALSRIYFVASILPMRVKMINKIESFIGKFIWTGSGILRIALQELKHDKLKGGLNLPCVATMNKSLLSSQCLRLLNSGDSKSVSHIHFWLGPLLPSIFPNMGLIPVARDTPEYFSFIGDCLATLMIEDVLTALTATVLTNRVIYRNMLKLEKPKVERDFPNVNFTKIWKLWQEYVPAENIDIMLKLLHNKLPVPERLRRVGVMANSLCVFCPGQDADIVHVLTSCLRVKICWTWLRRKVAGICQSLSQYSDWDLLHLNLPNSMRQKGIVWLISHYISYAWKHYSTAQGEMNLGQFFGFLTFKYKESQFNFDSIGFNL